jgi:glycosyltransferase involved in cell wall biosynthesis
MAPLFSIVIPAYNEANYLPEGLAAIERAVKALVAPVEVILADNQSTDATAAIAREWGARVVTAEPRCIAAVRNAGGHAAQGTYLVFVDADSRMSPNMLVEIRRTLESGKYVGGGVFDMRPDRWSAGIAATFALLYIGAWLTRISGGLFFTTREAFETIGGFDERLLALEDVDFAKRLKRYGRKKRQRFSHLRSATLHTSVRKFDTFGDWYIFRNPWKIIQCMRNDPRTADEIWYKHRD